MTLINLPPFSEQILEGKLYEIQRASSNYTTLAPILSIKGSGGVDVYGLCYRPASIDKNLLIKIQTCTEGFYPFIATVTHLYLHEVDPGVRTIILCGFTVKEIISI